MKKKNKRVNVDAQIVTEVTKNVFRHPYRDPNPISSLHQSRELSFAKKNSSAAIIQS